MDKKRLLVIDANSVVHRAFHALPPLTTKKGELVNAVYGFLLVFFKAAKDFKPDFVAACFDLPGPTFRHEKFQAYKAKRPPAPVGLYEQMPKVKQVLQALGVPVFEKQGFEADDIIGTIASAASRQQVLPTIETIILSGDKDTLQLVNENTKVCFLRKGVKDILLYDEATVREKFGGLTPEQLLNYKALRGDPSDNIPGVTGIGDKTAIELLLEFGDLENLYEKAQSPDTHKTQTEYKTQITNRLREKLLQYKEQAFLSREMARIDRNAPIDFNLKDCGFGEYNREKAAKALENLEFYSLTNRLP